MAIALVTGGTGFVGSWVARALCDAGHTVRILRRTTSSLQAVNDLDVEHFSGDVTDPATLPAALEGVDWVFHVAAVSAYWRNDKDSIYFVNVEGTRFLLEAAEAAGVKRFIFTSSGFSIGFREDGKAADETHQFNIDPRLSPYGHSKFLAEAEVYKAIARGLDCVILNPVVVLGPGDLNRISGSMVIEPAQGKVPFLPMQGGAGLVDVRDVASWHVAAAETGGCGERYLLGTVNMSHRAFFRLVTKIVGARAPFIPSFAPMVRGVAALVDIFRAVGLPLPADVEGNQLRLSTYNIYFDYAKAHRHFHEPRYDITQSILDTYNWYREHDYI